MSEVEHLLAVQCQAGESPHWDADSGLLYWADIVDPHLYRFDPATGDLKAAAIDVPVTGLGLRHSGGLVLASKTGFYLLDADWRTHRCVADPEADKPNVRFNDGLVDRQGRYWAGSLNETDFDAPDGSLYRLDPDGSVHLMDSGLKVCNGMGWSPDSRTMYLVDSGAYTIYAYDFDPEAGSVSRRRVLAAVPGDAGMPDGLTVDGEGCVWVGYWGGWRITRFDPAGQVVREIKLPVANVTSAVFGGPDLDELYITTAWFLLSEEDRKAQPGAGDLFRIKPGVRGLAEAKFRG
jgi:sugar lactone lactonase YvrE